MRVRHRRGYLRSLIGGAAVLLPLACAAPAFAITDPMPGDLIAPPVNINIGLFYDYFSDAGSFGQAHGSDIKQDTHFSNNLTVGRLIHIFSVDGYTAGVQGYVLYAQFIGNQQAGVNLPSAAPGLLPPIGAGKASYSTTNGFAQPNLSAFFYPINHPDTGTYAVISPWISPPVSSFNKNNALNPAQNIWNYEMEFGVRKLLIGTPKGANLSLEFWNETYWYGQNNNSADVGPTVDAFDLPPIYGYAHQNINPAIPGGNPIQGKTITPATFREQPTEEFRVFLPYTFAPAIGAYIAPGFYQSFGGKQSYKIHGDGEVVDTGNRTNETQLRLVAATFISPRMQLLAAGYYDLAAHGQPVNRTFLVRLGVFF
jgi:hypothetical protein